METLESIYPCLLFDFQFYNKFDPNSLHDLNLLPDKKKCKIVQNYFSKIDTTTYDYRKQLESYEQYLGNLNDSFLKLNYDDDLNLGRDLSIMTDTTCMAIAKKSYADILFNYNYKFLYKDNGYLYPELWFLQPSIRFSDKFFFKDLSESVYKMLIDHSFSMNDSIYQSVFFDPFNYADYLQQTHAFDPFLYEENTRWRILNIEGCKLFYSEIKKFLSRDLVPENKFEYDFIEPVLERALRGELIITYYYSH